jgi:uncharacterized membrane protein
VVASVFLAWILAAWIPALVPLGANVQVLSRSSPTLLDMAIALAAGAAGAYATIDERVSSSLTGVAIAVALVPPLSVVGIALEAGLWRDALGAFLLFATNLVSIILASTAVFVLAGIAPARKAVKDRLANADVFVSVVTVALLIMVPLGLTGGQALQTLRLVNQTESHVVDWLGADSRLTLLRIDVRKNEVDLILTGSGDVPSVAELEETLSRSSDSEVSVRVELFPSTVITSSNQRQDAASQLDSLLPGKDERTERAPPH